VQNENTLMEFERDKMNPKLTQNYWTQNLEAFEEFPHALSSPSPLSRAANKPVMMMPIWTQSFPQIIGTKLQSDLEKTTVQNKTKSLQRRMSSLTLFGKMFFFPCVCLSLKSNWGKRYK
jgi:hypothetical protein